MIESPRRTLKRVVLAQHKNYVGLLGCLTGIAACFGYAWLRDLGENGKSFLALSGTIVLIGPLFGMGLLATGGIIVMGIGALLGGKGTWRNSVSVLAYAAIPVVLALVFVLPAELAVFGSDLFQSNPGPMVIKPVPYVVLLGLDGLALLWSLLLLIEGTAVAHSLSRTKASFVVLALAAVGTGIMKAA